MTKAETYARREDEHERINSLAARQASLSSKAAEGIDASDFQDALGLELGLLPDASLSQAHAADRARLLDLLAALLAGEVHACKALNGGSVLFRGAAAPSDNVRRDPPNNQDAPKGLSEEAAAKIREQLIFGLREVPLEERVHRLEQKLTAHLLQDTKDAHNGETVLPDGLQIQLIPDPRIKALEARVAELEAADGTPLRVGPFGPQRPRGT